MRALLVEDDSNLVNSIVLELAEHGGIVCDTIGLGRDAIKASKIKGYDIIILDMMLPDIDGLQVLLKLRSMEIKTPIIILSGVTDKETVIKGLDNGADDYLTKPFSSSELIARMEAIIRRSKGRSKTIIKFDAVEINTEERLVYVNNVSLDVTPTEYAIVKLLAQNIGTVVSQEQCLKKIYNKQNTPKSKVIDVFICKLRDKFKKASGGKGYIETVWSRGYIIREKEITAA